MEEYLIFARSIARDAGMIILDKRESFSRVETKSDNSPVTEIDMRINDMVGNAIREKYPEHGYKGEEGGFGTGEEEYHWVCDPIDGTRPFVLGIPTSTFMLGLFQNNACILAVVHDPFEDRMYHAMQGAGAFCNDQPMQVNRTSLSEGYFLLASSVSDRMSKIYQGMKAEGAQLVPISGAGYKAMLIAKGKALGYVGRAGDVHDVPIGALIVEEAGGRTSDFDGNPFNQSEDLENGVLMTNGVIHDDVLAIIQDTQ